MAVDGDQEGDGLRVGPYLPESGVEPSDGSAQDAVTDLVPVVAAEPSQVDAPPAAEAARPGPLVLDADSWDTEPGSESSNVAYEGRRRAQAPPPRFWIAVTLVLVGLGAAIAVPLVLVASLTHDDVIGPPGAPSSQAGAAVDPGLGESLSATSSPGPNPSLTPNPSATPNLSASIPAVAPSTPTLPQPPPALPTPTPQAPFTPVTFEAEAGTRGGSAWIWENYPGASGGRIVRNIGDWNMSGGPGTLRIDGVVIPTGGTYVLTIYFVHPDGEQNRDAAITVSPGAAMTVAFVGSSACCATKVVSVVLVAGTQTITVANPADHAPSIDKIVLSRP